MRLHRLLILAVLITASTVLAIGQASSTGTILGRVADATGASLPGANVTILNTETGIDHKVITNQDGEYTIPELPPGAYKVTIEAPSFGTSINNVVVAVAQEARVDATLKLGGATETVSVESTGAQLDTDTAAVSQLVSEKQVNQLPLNGRNFLNLLFIGAGAVQTVGEQGQQRAGEGNAISISGGRPESNNYTLDGMTNTDTALNTPAVILSQDAIQEFKVQSETYSAEFGFGANQVNIVSKSGTNLVHGSVFEFDRNDAFDASTHFQQVKPELRQNQFGYVLGGPVFIPKVYDGRDKTFFLANYEGARIRAGTSPTDTFVPDPTQLSGNFSLSGLPAFGTPACTANLNFNSPCQPVDPLTGQPFPNNTIPTSRFSKIATVALGAKLIPAPNEPATEIGNYVLRTVLPNSTDQQTYRIDQSLKKYGLIFGRYTRAQYLTNSAGTTSIPAGVNVFSENSVSYEINYSLNIGQNNLNDFRYGNLSAKSIQGANAASTADVAALGLTGVFPNLPAYARGYPNLSIGGFNGTFGSPGNDPTTSDIPQNEFADSFTSLHGKHTLSFGFDFRSWVQKRDLSANFLGTYTYASATSLSIGGTAPGAGPDTANPCQTAYCGTGSATADFLLGYYASAGTFQPGPFSTPGVAGNLNQYRFKYFGPYFQDDWKATSNLTLNLGVRYDFRTIATEAHDKLFWIDKANTLGGLCFANKALLSDGIAPAGNGIYRYCGRDNPRDAAKLPFSPRFGFAYRPFGDNKTVVRGGYGIFFDSTETREIDDSGDLYPYVVRANLNPVAIPGVPKLTDNLFPVTSTPHTVSPATEGSQFIAVIISEDPINPYVQQYTLSVQRELAANTTLEVNYIGNKATHLLDRINLTQPLPVSDPAACNASQGQVVAGQLNTADCPAASRRPLPNFTSVALDSRWEGYSNYNAANVKLERRSADLAAVVVYTYSKSLDDKSAAAGIGATNGFAGHLDDRNPARDYARSDFDVGQRFVASFVYSLPFGTGKKFLGATNRAANLAVGGWEVTGIATFQKGFPFSVLGNDRFGLLSAFTQRANIIGPADGGFHKSLNQWFNTASFSQPLAGAYGTSGRNILRQPGINNFDIGALKNFSIYDRINLQVRAESFNTFNHAQYGVDPSSPTAAASGPGTGAIDDNVNDQNQPVGGNNNFGKVVQARPGRVLQLGAKVTF